MSISINKLKYIFILFTVVVLFFLSLEVRAQSDYPIIIGPPKEETTYILKPTCLCPNYADYLACVVSEEYKCVSSGERSLPVEANQNADCSKCPVNMCVYEEFSGINEEGSVTLVQREVGNFECKTFPALQGHGAQSSDPVRALFGGKQTDSFKILIPSGYSVLKLECKSCQSQGLNLQYTSGNEFGIEFDSGSSKLPLGFNEINFEAQFSFNTDYPLSILSLDVNSNLSLSFKIYYEVYIDCSKEIDQEDCTKDQSQPKQVACKQKCEARSFCKYVYGKCKFDADVNDQERAQLGEEAVMNRLKEEYAMDPNYKGPIPPCAFSGTCRNTNDFLSLFLRYAKSAFAMIAAFAFAFFVYGGFMIIISFGNAEKVKKGQQILGAAVIGLIIVFGAYMIINFLMEALGIRADFRGF